MELTVIKKILTALTLLFLATTANALVLDALYQADVPVSSQDGNERTRAIRKGLEEVLIRVSGNSSVATVGAVQNNLHKTDSLVQQYSYSRQKTSASGPSRLALRVRFDAAGVDLLLKRAGQAVWGTNRPLVLVWMAKQEIGERTLIGSDSEPRLSNALQEVAGHRGLPTIMPVMDIHDMQSIRFEDVWNPHPINVKEASKRYDTDAVLTGRLKELPDGRWSGHWELLLTNDEQVSWDYNESSEEKIIAEAINDMADAMASRFAVLESVHKKSQVTMKIGRVDTFQEYEKVMSYLRGLAPVSKIQVDSMKPEEVVFKLDVIGGQQSLIQAIGLNQLLRPVKRSDYTLLGGTSLDYVYTR